MGNQYAEKSHYFLQSLAKGLTVLQTMAKAPQPLSLTKISPKAGISNTTTRCIHYPIFHGVRSP